MLRKCSKCKEEKPVAEFGGKDRYCRNCRKQYRDAHRGAEPSPRIVDIPQGGRPFKEMDLGAVDLAEPTAIDLTDRAKLKETLRTGMGGTLAHYENIIRVELKRLDAAIKSKDAIKIDRALTAYNRAVTAKANHELRLLEKMDSLMPETEKSVDRPITIQRQSRPERPPIVACPHVPEITGA